MAIVAFMTDWGNSHYVAQAKAVMLRINPELEIVDVTHHVPAYDIRAGMHILQRVYRDFPEGTVFLAVIDPGVGTGRRAIAGRIGGYYFVAPDNGLISLMLREEGDWEIVSLENPDYWYTRRPTYTFHGRDIFAPAAAHIASGVPLGHLGPFIRQPVLLEVMEPKWDGKWLEVEVAYTDAFGNVELYLRDLPWNEEEYPRVKVGQYVAEVVKTYGDVPAGTMIFHRESSGYWEIAVSQGSAAEALEVSSGSHLRLSPIK